MENISKNITYLEATQSDTAIRYGIKNIPDGKQLEAMRLVANEVFEKIRVALGKPLRVSSFFRGKELNDQVKGSSTSQHCKGEAIDIQAIASTGLTNAQIFEFVKNNITFDQMIWEFGTKEQPAWVHVSYSKTKNRKEILRASVKAGKTIYEKF